MTIAATIEHPTEDAGARARRILLVEDEPTLRNVIARNLVSRGLVVQEAGTAQDAVQMATAARPDLLLLDINLPDQTGWDVLRELRRRSSEVPTIILSAVRVGHTRLDEFHPIAYLPKPFPIDALLRLVFQSRDDAGSTPDEDV
ncbi:MAG TPA: response regulator [Chloroflexota bacterium]|jgi:DNA-binding response OmpR family regulator